MVALALIVLAAVLPPGGTFIDDDGNVHEGSIEAIAEARTTLGCNPPANNRFCLSRVKNLRQIRGWDGLVLGWLDSGRRVVSC